MALTANTFISSPSCYLAQQDSELCNDADSMFTFDLCSCDGEESVEEEELNKMKRSSDCISPSICLSLMLHP